MKPIKFRAWDKVAEEMLDMVTVACEREVHWSPLYVKGGIIDEIDHQDYVLMQYTGLRDSKRTKEYPDGQEIYEGDIVKYKDCGKEHVSKIIQDFSLGTGHYIRCPGLGFYTINESTIVMLEIEVIGNIYENPELLECEE